jgi:hypothetical protein
VSSASAGNALNPAHPSTNEMRISSIQLLLHQTSFVEAFL